jgi:hypothetical protein
MSHVQQQLAILDEIGAGSLVEQTINKLITMQIARYQNTIHQIKRELQEFEQRFQLSSEECYQRFNTGELGDSADMFEWVGLYENILLYQKRINILRMSLQ